MAPKVQQVTPLIDIQSTKFADYYQHGVWWSMHGDEQGKGPVSTSYLITNLKQYAACRYFERQDPYHRHYIGFFLGMYHGGILSPQTGQLRPDVTMLAILDHKDARRGYSVGREWYFHEATPQERRLNEQSVIVRLCELVTENPYQQKDNTSTWYYCIGCLLGDLSGQVFPETQAERRAWIEECRKWEAEQGQEARVVQRSKVLQEA
jgi:hypothetical protein